MNSDLVSSTSEKLNLFYIKAIQKWMSFLSPLFICKYTLILYFTKGKYKVHEELYYL